MRLTLVKMKPEPTRPGIPLERAMFCADCETVDDHTRNGRCPHCGSNSVVPIARWIFQPMLNDRVVDPARRG